MEKWGLDPISVTAGATVALALFSIVAVCFAHRASTRQAALSQRLTDIEAARDKPRLVVYDLWRTVQEDGTPGSIRGTVYNAGPIPAARVRLEVRREGAAEAVTRVTMDPLVLGPGEAAEMGATFNNADGVDAATAWDTARLGAAVKRIGRSRDEPCILIKGHFARVIDEVSGVEMRYPPPPPP